MGCVNSSNGKRSCKKEHTVYAVTDDVKFNQSELTDKEKQIIKRTWSYLTKDLAENGLQVFLRIFELSNDAKKLFNVEDVRHSELSKNPTIKEHGLRFILAISAAVNCLNEADTDQDEINKILLALGQKHKHFEGFRPEYFEIFYESLMWRWGICMGDKFTKEVSDTWSHVFLFMMEKLKEGYNTP